MTLPHPVVGTGIMLSVPFREITSMSQAHELIIRQ
jgi:hypothetical protein